MNGGPLDGRLVVVTRAAEQSTDLVDAIEAAGGSVLLMPMLSILEPDDPRALERAIERIGVRDWLVVTSSNAARRVVELDVDPAARPQVAVVGPSTAAVFESTGWTVHLRPGLSRAESLVAEFPDPEPDRRVLVAQGDLARPTVVEGLRDAGWEVDVAVAYRNVIPSIDEQLVPVAVSASAVVFASPTAATRYAEHIGVEPGRAVCIGPVTGDAASRLGFDVSIAATTSAGDIVAAVAEVVCS